MHAARQMLTYRNKITNTLRGSFRSLRLNFRKNSSSNCFFFLQNKILCIDSTIVLMVYDNIFLSYLNINLYIFTFVYCHEYNSSSITLFFRISNFFFRSYNTILLSSVENDLFRSFFFFLLSSNSGFRSQNDIRFSNRTKLRDSKFLREKLPKLSTTKKWSENKNKAQTRGFHGNGSKIDGLFEHKRTYEIIFEVYASFTFRSHRIWSHVRLYGRRTE